MSGKNMLVQAFLSLLLIESVYAAQACHSDAPTAVSVQYTSGNGSYLSLTRASCYHDVAFYYNAALLARPISEYVWLEDWVREAWAYHRKNFGGRQCEDFGAPKPLIIYAFLDPSNTRSNTNTRYQTKDGAQRNFIKIELTSFAKTNPEVKEMIGRQMSTISEVMTQGTFNNEGTTWLWTKEFGVSQLPLYDFFHQTGDIVSRDRWPSGSAPGPSWFSFFYALWLDNGKNLHFLTKFWNYYSLYYPKSHSTVLKEWGQAANINIGEAIHFLSAAVGRNLTALAASKFTTGWKPQTYFAAVAQYPALTYDS
ncbi:hypothetical protein DFS34DRAFT_595823 [Phlyctochytrium arcticum]|nr:hypothetical protein DFS34DRAFT_595823 [Phlyctochytrium arcticum]